MGRELGVTVGESWEGLREGQKGGCKEPVVRKEGVRGGDRRGVGGEWRGVGGGGGE